MPLDQTAIVCVSRLRRHERERERAVVRPTRFELARTNPVGLESTPLDHSGTVAKCVCVCVCVKGNGIEPLTTRTGILRAATAPTLPPTAETAPQCEILNH